MNQQDIAPSTASTSSTPTHEIPGLARVKEMTAAPGSRVPKNTLLGDFVGGVLKLVSRVLNPEFLAASLAYAKTIGHFAVLAGAALTLIYAIVGAVRVNAFSPFVAGLGFVVAYAVAQFAASRFLDAADTLIAGAPSRVSSPAFLECVGLLALLFAAGTLVLGVIGAIAARSVTVLLPAILTSASLTYFAAVALHPRVVNVATAEGSAGEEAIGLLAFFFKTGLKLVPLYFGLLAVGGCLTVLVGLFSSSNALASMAQGAVDAMPFTASMPPGFAGSALLLIACLLPIGAYFVFLLQYLAIDLVRAVLSVPAKLDALKR